MGLGLILVTLLFLLSLSAIGTFCYYITKASSGARDEWKTVLTSALKAQITGEKGQVSDEDLKKTADDMNNFLRSVTAFQGVVMSMLLFIVICILYCMYK